MREAVWVTIDFGHGEDGRPACLLWVLVQIIRVVRIRIQQVKSEASTLSLEELALPITPLVALVLGVETRIGLHGKDDEWNIALARRGREPLESTHNALGANHVTVLLWQRRIFIEVFGLPECRGPVHEVERWRVSLEPHDTVVNGIRQIE